MAQVKCGAPSCAVLTSSYCQRCHKTAYCSRACQAAHYREHKPQCTAAPAAAGAQGGCAPPASH